MQGLSRIVSGGMKYPTNGTGQMFSRYGLLTSYHFYGLNLPVQCVY